MNYSLIHPGTHPFKARVSPLIIDDLDLEVMSEHEHET